MWASRFWCHHGFHLSRTLYGLLDTRFWKQMMATWAWFCWILSNGLDIHQTYRIMNVGFAEEYKCVEYDLKYKIDWYRLCETLFIWTWLISNPASGAQNTRKHMIWNLVKNIKPRDAGNADSCQAPIPRHLRLIQQCLTSLQSSASTPI